ncbi:MAG: glycosyltransferase family 2 protein [Cytophagales bacterium]|nr:glycosyltransferase family 2 protein [Cytophagales bacterium]
MKEQIELAVIMPVYNEAEIIEYVIKSWIDELKKHEINFQIHAYNDGSTDNTFSILNTIAKKHEILIVHNKANNGHGPTLLQGYRENSNIEWIFQVDSDNEISSDHFSKFWEKREQYDFLIGRRIRRNLSFTRKTISFFSRITIRLFYGKRMGDINSPYRLMKTSKFKDAYNNIPISTFAVNVIIVGVACLKRLKIIEIPVSCQKRKTGEGYSEKLTFFIMTAVISFYQTIRYRYSFK